MNHDDESLENLRLLTELLAEYGYGITKNKYIICPGTKPCVEFLKKLAKLLVSRHGYGFQCPAITYETEKAVCSMAPCTYRHRGKIHINWDNRTIFRGKYPGTYICKEKANGVVYTSIASVYRNFDLTYSPLGADGKYVLKLVEEFMSLMETLLPVYKYGLKGIGIRYEHQDLYHYYLGPFVCKWYKGQWDKEARLGLIVDLFGPDGAKYVNSLWKQLPLIARTGAMPPSVSTFRAVPRFYERAGYSLSGCIDVLTHVYKYVFLRDHAFNHPKGYADNPQVYADMCIMVSSCMEESRKHKLGLKLSVFVKQARRRANPKDLHDWIVTVYNNIRQEVVDKDKTLTKPYKLSAEVSMYAKECMNVFLSHGADSVALPNNRRDVVLWGTEQTHCIGSYAKDHGKSVILLEVYWKGVRTHACVDVYTGLLNQWHAKFNANVDVDEGTRNMIAIAIDLVVNKAVR